MAGLSERGWNTLRRNQMLRGDFLNTSPGQLVEMMSVTLGLQVRPPRTIELRVAPGGTSIDDYLKLRYFNDRMCMSVRKECMFSNMIH